jgi:hypothetical protein
MVPPATTGVGSRMESPAISGYSSNDRMLSNSWRSFSSLGGDGLEAVEGIGGYEHVSVVLSSSFKN